MRAEAKPLCWVRKPGDDSHSLICDTVSSCRIFFCGVRPTGGRVLTLQLRFQLGLFGGNVFFKGVRSGSATRHDTTSLRLQGNDTNLPAVWRRFPSVGHGPSTVGVPCQTLGLQSLEVRAESIVCLPTLAQCPIGLLLGQFLLCFPLFLREPLFLSILEIFHADQRPNPKQVPQKPAVPFRLEGFTEN